MLCICECVCMCVWGVVLLVIASVIYYTGLLAREASPQWGGEWNFVLPCMPVCGIYICNTCLNWWVHRRFHGLELKKEGNRRRGKPTIERLICQWWRKWLEIQRPEERSLDLLATWLVNICQGKDAGALFSLTTQLIHTLALDVIQVLYSMNYFQSC